MPNTTAFQMIAAGKYQLRSFDAYQRTTHTVSPHQPLPVRLRRTLKGHSYILLVAIHGSGAS